MRNPAWRPARSYSARLADISHHLLGRPAAPPESPETSTVRELPVLVAAGDDHPSGALSADYLLQALTRELNLSVYGSNRDYRWEACAVVESTEIKVDEVGFVLVFTTASLPGIRRAYTLLKPLMERGGLNAGVLLSGAADTELAHRCSRHLLQAAMHFFDKALADFGHVDAPGPEFGRTLARMGEQIHQTWNPPLGRSGGKEEDERS